MNKQYVQYGCGMCAPLAWINFDSSPTVRFERIPLIGQLYKKNAVRFPDNVQYGDIVRGLPIEAESCDGIYCSHVLEHLAYEDCLVALRNTYVYLKPGGIFRLVVPDLEQLVNEYVGKSHDSPAVWLMKATQLGQFRRPRGLRELCLNLLGNAAHRWMWDEKSLRNALRDTGFTDVRLAAYGDASDLRFADVEDPSRFEGCLAMQCVK